MRFGFVEVKWGAVSVVSDAVMCRSCPVMQCMVPVWYRGVKSGYCPVLCSFSVVSSCAVMVRFGVVVVWCYFVM